MYFYSKLIISLFLFSLQSIFIFLKTFFEKIILIIIVLLAILLFFLPAPKKIIELVSKPAEYSPLPLSLAKKINDLQVESLTDQEIQQRIVFFETILEKQPTHFDSLISLSFLYGAINNREKSQEMWGRAEQLNPNSPFFISK